MNDLAIYAKGRLDVWSCGGGTQSAAIAALIVQGALPKPERAIIVDTGRENSSTWDYLEVVLRPRLREVGVKIERVHKEDYAKVDLYTPAGDLSLPVYTEKGKMPTFCSNEWKRRVLQRHLRATGVTSCRVWIGISTDELRRVRQSDLGWCLNHYPLIFDVPMSRAACIAKVKAMGWPAPPRSSCWMCPNKGDAEWIEEKRERPNDFAKAVQLEREIRAKDAGFYLHKSRTPIDQATFEDAEGEADGCQTGFCFT